jgi:DNA-binding SARP family transcriptional activator
MIRLRTLGPLEVTLDGAPAPAELLWKKNVAVLLYLARATKRRCTREQLIGLLWSEKADAAARQSMREAIRVLRHYVGDDRLKTTGDVIELAAGAIELDTDDFEKHVQQRDWARTTPLIAGEFLEGFTIADATGFEDWLTVERSYWHGLSVDALLRHAEDRLDAGDELGADAPLRRARTMDPWSQRALRAHMRRVAIAGDPSGALQLFHRFSRDALREGNLVIEQETNALVDRLRSGRAWRLPRGAQTPEGSVAWRRAPLLGRARELAGALAQWQRVRREGRLALLVVEAESGGGKTRFLEELSTRAGLDGGVAVRTRAIPADLDQPASAMLGLARGGLSDSPGVAGANPAALAALAAHSSEWAERFPPRTETAPSASIDAAIIEVLRVAGAERPHLVIFDDAQWMDETSFQHLDRVLRDLAGTPLLIVLAATPEPAPPKLAELRARIGRDIPGSVIPLGRLSVELIRELVRWALPAYADDSADRLARRIAADSAGLPLLAVEICHATAQGLDLAAVAGDWPHPMRTLDSTFPGDLPDTIVASIRVGFRCLTRAAQQALSGAAVLGDRVAAEQIGRAAGLEGEALHAALDELEWRRWLVADSRGYAFVARIVRDVVARDMLTEGQRQRILATNASAGPG